MYHPACEGRAFLLIKYICNNDIFAEFCIFATAIC